MSGMEFRVGSAPARSGGFGQRNSDVSPEPPLCGFLNRKCMIEAGGKKTKDRSWQTYWCQLKGVSLEFHKVDGVKSEGFKPPPRDIYPPPHMAQHKAGFVSVAGATAGDDYTSQIGKDLQKRRSWLFELTLSNQTVYLLQAPNGTQRAQWIQHIRRSASGQEDDVESRKLKAARCSVRHRSRQNVFSLKAGQVVHRGEEDVELVTAVGDNTCTHMLQEMLRAKKELLSQMNRMCNSFLGDTLQLHSEDIQKVPELVSSPQRLVFPSPAFSSVDNFPQRASTGVFGATTLPQPPTRVTCHLLKDYLLVPGASWSQLRLGDEVVVTGRLANGWFRCFAQRDVTPPSQQDVLFPPPHLPDPNMDYRLPPSHRHSAASTTIPEALSPTPEAADSPSRTMEWDTGTGSVTAELSAPDSVDTGIEEDTCSLQDSNASHNQETLPHDGTSDQSARYQDSTPHIMHVGRSYSYIAATQTNPESSLLFRNPRRSLDYSLLNKKIVEDVAPLEMERKKTFLLEKLLLKLSEPHSHSYRFPLVGVIPPSVVEKVPGICDIPLISSAVYSQPPSYPIGPAVNAPSPAHSSTQLGSPNHSSFEELNGHASTPTHSHQSATPTYQARKQHPGSSSAPTTPLHSLAESPVPPSDLSLSPSTSPLSHHRTYEPVTAMFDNTFIKRLLPRKKPSKQVSLPDKLSLSKPPAMEEISPSPSPIPPSPPHSLLPTPAMLKFSEREFQADMRTRVSSVSGQRVRCDGVCLQLGEEESSSESGPESSTELDLRGRVALSQITPSEPGFHYTRDGYLCSTPSLSCGFLVPSPVSPDILAPGNLRRAASAHGFLHIKHKESESISSELLSKSASAHSFTSPSISGIHNSLKKYPHAELENRQESPTRERSPTKQKQQGMTVRPVSPKLGGIFKPPPVGQKRFVYLDTRQPKYGFRLERYGHPSELKQEMRVFVQSVSPGSPAFMSGLFPGDTITELNGISVRSDTVAVLVKKIQDRPQQNDKLVHVDRRHCAHTADA